MGNNELAGRRVLMMPKNPDGLRGQQRDTATKVEALALQKAIIDSLDILHLFDEGERPVLVAGGEVRNIGSEQLRWIISETFVTKHVVRKLPGLKCEVEHRPVYPSEMAVRALLTKEPNEGGLRGKLPVLEVETQGFTAPAAPEPPAALGLPDDPPEILAGRRTAARYADSDKKRELEMKRGAEVVERYRRGQQVAPAVQPPAEDHPVFIENQEPPAHVPAEAKDSAADPTRPSQA